MYVDKATQKELIEHHKKMIVFYENAKKMNKMIFNDEYQDSYDEDIEKTELTLWILKNTFKKWNKNKERSLKA